VYNCIDTKQLAVKILNIETVH